MTELRPIDSGVRAFCPFAGEWLAPDEWYASQMREAKRRQGVVFALRNMWARLLGKPTRVHGNDMQRGIQMLWESMVRS